MPNQGSSRNRPRVVVVGAGIIGASIAFQISRRNSPTTVLDKGQPGSGASSHSFAWINAAAKRPVAYHDLNRRSMEMWERFARDLHMDVGLTWGGQLVWESTADGAALLLRQLEDLQRWGYPCRQIDEAELRELEPGLSPGAVTAAAINQADGHVDPKKVVDACLFRAIEAGAEVQCNATVTGLNLMDSGDGTSKVRSVVTDRGEYPCDVLVLAAGIETTRLAALAGVSVPQQYSPGVVMQTDPRPPLLSTAAVLYAPQIDPGHPEVHLRQMANGVVQIGEGTQESLSRDDSQSHADDLLARATNYLPALSGARAYTVPVGIRPMPRDGFPAIGFPSRVPNMYVALMHSGVTLAPLVAELAALEIVDGARVEALEPYRPDRISLGGGC